MMRKRKLQPILAILSMTALGHANNAHSNGQKAANLPDLYQYDNRTAVFTPLHPFYERIKPESFYVGVEAFLIVLNNKHKHPYSIFSELRLGYNFFFNGKDHLTPFLGGGYFQNFDRHHGASQLPAVGFGAIGLLYTHEFNNVVNLGVNAQMLLGGGVNKRRYDWGSPVIGYDLSIPFTLRFGPRRHWDYRIEPFSLFLHGSNAWVAFFGFRNTIGYRF